MALRNAIPEMRESLERAWTSRTIHPAFADQYRAGKPIGQCGVSSVWLARRLRSDFNVEGTYCYGDLSFDDARIGSVRRHCWIEIGDLAQADRLVIDLTADQASGFGERVIVFSMHDLRARGIYYDGRIRKGLDELPADAVWPRFLILSDIVDNSEEAAA